MSVDIVTHLLEELPHNPLLITLNKKWDCHNMVWEFLQGYWKCGHAGQHHVSQ